MIQRELVGEAALQAPVPALAGIGLVLTSCVNTPLHNRRIVNLLRASLLGRDGVQLRRDEEQTITERVDALLRDLGNSLESVLREQLGDEYEKICLERGFHA